MAGRSVTVSWAATTLATGQAVNGYQVKRYDAGTAAAQTILSACAGAISATTCTESSVPVGAWKYTVTPLFATNWRGDESATSSAVTVAAPALSFSSSTTVKPGAILNGTAANFSGGETLVYRLDDPTTGTVLTGTLAGSPTPAAVPAGGGGAVVATVPAGTSDGAHTVYAVASPNGDTAAASIVVDGTRPTIDLTFPVWEAYGSYQDTTYDAGCGTAGIGDICDTTSDAGSGVSTVEIALRPCSTGLYLTGDTFSAASKTWIMATGTASWTYALDTATFPTDDMYVLNFRATDAAGNIYNDATVFYIDRTAPTGVDFTTVNKSGGTAGRLEAGDTFTLAYSEAVDPASIISGWDGTGSRNVVVRLANGTSSTDTVTVWNTANSSQLQFGSVNLNGDYVGPVTRTFGLAGTPTTLTMSGSSFTLTLGTAASGVEKTETVGSNAVWTPNNLATDPAGNGVSTATRTQSGNTVDFSTGGGSTWRSPRPDVQRPRSDSGRRPAG